MSHRLINLRKTTAGCTCGAEYTGEQLRAQHAAHKAEAEGKPVAAKAIAKKATKAASPKGKAIMWKSSAKAEAIDISGLGLPEGSARFFADAAYDAGNWSGSPLIGGNIASGRSAGGWTAKLKAAGLVTSYQDEDDTSCYWLVFTEAGRKLAEEVLGFDPDPYARKA
jgi:hypothetical protein